jgi:D-sedoheptulose 7-phosphate isomerase
MEKIVQDIFNASIEAKQKTLDASCHMIAIAAEKMAECLVSGHKILLFGNGGSAADAQHIAAEFVNRFMVERMPLAAIALTTDTSVITSIGNDYSFDEIFSKQIEAFGEKDDIAFGITTSGNSPNVLLALEAAKKKGLITMGLTGVGGKITGCADYTLSVPSSVTARIQETHITIGHALCEIVDRTLFPEKFLNA